MKRTEIRLTPDEHDQLEKYRARHGLKSLNAAVKRMIAVADVKIGPKSDAILIQNSGPGL